MISMVVILGLPGTTVCLFYLIFPILGLKPVVLSFSKPSFGFCYADPVVKIIEAVKISFSDGKTDGFPGESACYR